MHHKRLFLVLSFFSFFNAMTFAQLDKFQQPLAFPDLHTVYEYKKSNWDGTHASAIFLYISDSNRLESFKWAKGDKVATLVTADIDWNIFSVQQFQNHRLRTGQAPQLVARLATTGEKKIRIEAGEMKDSMIIDELPWQSYDFDFAGLGFTWRALRNKKNSFYFHIADAAQKDGKVSFVNKGIVQVDFLGNESVNGRECFKYKIDGIGLENKGGYIWIEPNTFMIQQYKIALPDEPGFENGMLQLTGTKKMTPEQWTTFMNQRLEE